MVNNTRNWTSGVGDEQAMCCLICYDWHIVPSATICFYFWYSVAHRTCDLDIVIYLCIVISISWWRHQMETCSALPAHCAGNSPVTGVFPSHRPLMRSFDVFFDLRLNKWSSKQPRGWWFETPLCSLCPHCNVYEWFFVSSIHNSWFLPRQWNNWWGKAYTTKLCRYCKSQYAAIHPMMSRILRLTHWGRDKMDDILQTTFSNRFSWMKIDELRWKIH